MLLDYPAFTKWTLGEQTLETHVIDQTLTKTSKDRVKHSKALC